MTFLINGDHYSLCRPYTGEHVWTWAGGDTLTECWPDKLCDCGTIKYKDRNDIICNYTASITVKQEEGSEDA